MPSLQNIQCSVHWQSTRESLVELNPTYSDGCVETWILVPDELSGMKDCNGQFYVQMNTTDCIAPDIDGVYQCNRNRRMPNPDIAGSRKTASQITMRARQKERFFADGSMFGSSWHLGVIQCCDKTVNNPQQKCSTHLETQNYGNIIGVIEVVIIRCSDLKRTSSPMPLFREPAGILVDESGPKDNFERRPVAKLAYKNAQRSTVRVAMHQDDCRRLMENPQRIVMSPAQDTKPGHECGFSKENICPREHQFRTNCCNNENSSKNSNTRGGDTQPSHKKLPSVDICANLQSIRTTLKHQYQERWTSAAFDGGLGQTQSVLVTEQEQLDGIVKVAATHHLVTGQPSQYLHKLAKPQYIDSLEEPYAVFRFHYRDMASLQHILAVDVSEIGHEERAFLETLSKEQLVSKILEYSPPRSYNYAASNPNQKNAQKRQATRDDWKSKKHQSGYVKSEKHHADYESSEQNESKKNPNAKLTEREDGTKKSVVDNVACENSNLSRNQRKKQAKQQRKNKARQNDDSDNDKDSKRDAANERSDDVVRDQLCWDDGQHRIGWDTTYNKSQEEVEKTSGWDDSKPVHGNQDQQEQSDIGTKWSRRDNSKQENGSRAEKADAKNDWVERASQTGSKASDKDDGFALSGFNMFDEDDEQKGESPDVVKIHW